MTQTLDIAAIASGLTKAQRTLLLELPAYSVVNYPPRKALLTSGLAIVVCPPARKLHATQLGLAVRAHIIANQTEGRG